MSISDPTPTNQNIFQAANEVLSSNYRIQCGLNEQNDINKKYILTDESKQFAGKTVYRIKALRSFGKVKKGDLGGWIETYNNLSQYGNCWVGDNAQVAGDVNISIDAQIYDNAQISGMATIWGDARIYGKSVLTKVNKISDRVEISGKTHLAYTDCSDSAKISDSLLFGKEKTLLRIGGRNSIRNIQITLS
jgi:hypothetical protein